MSTANPVVVMSSGGKDSLYMLECLRADPAWQVVSLLTTINETNGRVAMHGTSEQLVRLQADSLGLPLVLVGLPEHCDNAEYEKRLAVGLEPFRAQGIDRLACGDLFLDDIKQWREAVFDRLDWQPIFPLWHEPTDQLARTMIRSGLSATICCVDTHKLPTDFLGRPFDTELLKALPADIDPCGENGEFHSFVHDGPGFRQSLAIGRGRTVFSHDRYAMLELTF